MTVIDNDDVNEVEVLDGPVLYYRELEPEDWGKAEDALAAAYPNGPIRLDPETQRLVVAQTEDGTVVATAIVSAMYVINFAAPVDVDLDLSTLQSVAESLLPSQTVYYTMLQQRPESAEVAEELAMHPCPGVVVYSKQTA